MDEAAERRGKQMRVWVAAGMGALITAIMLCLIPEWNPDAAFSAGTTRRYMQRLDATIDAYRQKFHHLPPALSSLYELPDKLVMVPVHPDGTLRDGWGHPLVYRVRGDSYEVVSYGADGKPGGLGIDADLTNCDPRQIRSAVDRLAVSFQLLALPSSRGMVLAALFSGAVTAGFCWRMIKPAPFTRARLFHTAFTLICTFIAAGFVGLMITMLHIPSGH